MYKVYLVDDEKWVLDELACMINWQKYGFEICGYTVFPETAGKRNITASPEHCFYRYLHAGYRRIEIGQTVDRSAALYLFLFRSGTRQF